MCFQEETSHEQCLYKYKLITTNICRVNTTEQLYRYLKCMHFSYTLKKQIYIYIKVKFTRHEFSDFDFYLTDKTKSIHVNGNTKKLLSLHLISKPFRPGRQDSVV